MNNIQEWYQLCVDNTLTKGTKSGFYNNTLEEPFPIYNWVCLEDGLDERLYLYINKTELEYNQTINGAKPTIPAYMKENKNWFGNWVILITYWASGFMSWFGYFIFFPI